MERYGYIINDKNIINLIYKNIYDPVSDIVEMAANFYDADAEEVKIKIETEKEYIKEIELKGDGDGMSYDELVSLRTIGKSNKIEEVYTSKFHRRKLGAYGIAFIAFATIGKLIDIYSKYNGKILHMSIRYENDSVIFSEIEQIIDSEFIHYDSGCVFFIRSCYVKKSVLINTGIKKNKPVDFLENKLSFLPISSNFKIYINDKQINRFEVDKNTYTEEIDFELYDVKFHGEIYCTKDRIENEMYRGIFLKIDDRIIDWNIFEGIKEDMKSPISINNKIYGYITANEIRERLNAKRTGLTDSSLSLDIANNIIGKIRNIVDRANNFYSQKGISSNKKEKDTDESSNKSQSISDTNFPKKNISSISNNKKKAKNKRKEKVKKRIENEDLKRLGIKFCFEPEYENEVIVIATQLWQKNFLDIEFRQITSVSSPDCIIANGENMFTLEFEKSLASFSKHNHNHDDVDYLLCWDYENDDFIKFSQYFIDKLSRYVKLVNTFDNGNGIYSFECEDFDGNKHTIKLYILSEIVKYL